MASVPYILLSTAIFQLVSCGNAWFYQSPSTQPNNQLLSKHQFLLPPYPTYEHELLHQPPPSHLSLHENRFYGSPGEFAEPTSYNELNFEGPYEVTAPRVPGLYFRLSSGVFVPVKAVYSFPPFLERIIQRIQGYYSIYNPPETLGLDRPIAGGGVPLPPTIEILPVLPPNSPPPPPPGGLGPKPDVVPLGPPTSAEPPVETPSKPAEEPTPSGQPESDSTTTTTESTREETTKSGDISSEPDSLDSTTDATVEQTTNTNA